MAPSLSHHDRSLFCQRREFLSVFMAHGKPGYRRCNLVQESTSDNIRPKLSLTNFIEVRRTLRSEHTVPSDAGHTSSLDTWQSRFLRIGQWPSRLRTDLATSPIALRSHSIIHRTGTDLQNEELSIGTARSRTRSDNQMHSESEHEPGEVSLPHNASSSQHSTVLEDLGQDLPYDYYQFEWFWILIGMILLMVIEAIVIVLDVFGNVVTFWQNVLTFIAIGLFSLLLYIGFFVVLREYHEVVENFFHKYTRMRPGLQHICLRVCAYIYALGVNAVIFSSFLPLLNAYLHITCKLIRPTECLLSR